jgi:uncharacterized integral membrane protein
MESVQRSLIIGILVGVVVGCLLGLLVGTYYAWNVDPAVYVDGSRPNELEANYQDQYIAAVVDSYIVNRNVEAAKERLKTFSPEQQVRALGRRTADFVANGQAVESQLVNELALSLKSANGWPDQTIQNVIGQLAIENQSDSARSQGINTFSASLLNAVPQPATGGAEPAPAAPAPTEGGSSWTRYLLACLLILILLVVAIWLAGRWQLSRKKSQPKPQIAWEGEGPAPIKVWSGTYTLGQDNYDEFFTIETLDGDFLGESGVGIMKSIPGTSPKQVTAFDVGLFDKTDITTLSRVVMSEHAYHNDADLIASIEANPQAEAILAEPGREFVLETGALRVMARLDELEYGEGNRYFDKLKVTLHVFIQEGADLRIGTMDVPEQFQT